MRGLTKVLFQIRVLRYGVDLEGFVSSVGGCFYFPEVRNISVSYQNFSRAGDEMGFRPMWRVE